MQKYSDMVCVICGKTNPEKHQDVCRDPECGGRMVRPAEHKKAASLKRDLDFLKAIILTCPACGEIMEIEDPRGNRFKTVCSKKCSTWRIDFKITEV